MTVKNRNRTDETLNLKMPLRVTLGGNTESVFFVAGRWQTVNAKGNNDICKYLGIAHYKIKPTVKIEWIKEIRTSALLCSDRSRGEGWGVWVRTVVRGRETPSSMALA